MLVILIYFFHLSSPPPSFLSRVHTRTFGYLLSHTHTLHRFAHTAPFLPHTNFLFLSRSPPISSTLPPSRISCMQNFTLSFPPFLSFPSSLLAEDCLPFSSLHPPLTHLPHFLVHLFSFSFSPPLTTPPPTTTTPTLLIFINTRTHPSLAHQ